MIDMDALSAQTHRQAMLACAQFCLDRARTSIPTDDPFATDELIFAASKAIEAYHAVTTVWPRADEPEPRSHEDKKATRDAIIGYHKNVVSTLDAARARREGRDGA